MAGSDDRWVKMKRSGSQIAVAVFAATFFLTVAVAHACAGMTSLHTGHNHDGIEFGSLPAASHTEAPGHGCDTVHGRLLSLGPERSSHVTVWTHDLHAFPIAIGGFS